MVDELQLKNAFRVAAVNFLRELAKAEGVTAEQLRATLTDGLSAIFENMPGNNKMKMLCWGQVNADINFYLLDRALKESSK